MERFPLAEENHEEVEGPEADGVSRRDILKGAGALLGAAIGSQIGISQTEAGSHEALIGDREKHYEALKEIVSKERVREKLDYLKSVYGDTHGDFLYAFGIEEDLEFLKQLDEKMAKGDKTALASPDGIMVPGSVVSEAYRGRWQAPSKETVQELSRRPVAVSGFENRQVGTADVQEIIAREERFYPRGWLRVSVGSIQYRPSDPEEEARARKRYGIDDARSLGGMKSREGISRLIERDPRAPVTISEIAGKDREEALRKFFQILDHETGHANDWANSMALANHERVTMLYEVTRQFMEGQRTGTLLRSGYMEAIRNDGDKQRELYLKVGEYWGELCREFFNEPAKLARNHPGDFRFVKKWILRVDPAFNPAWGREHRERFIQSR